MNVLDVLEELRSGAVPGVVVHDPTDPSNLYTSSINVQDWDSAVELAQWLKKKRVAIEPMGVDMCRLTDRGGSVRVSSVCPLWVGARVLSQIAFDLGYDTIKEMARSKLREERVSDLSTLINERLDAMPFASTPALDSTAEVLATLISDAMATRYGYAADSMDATAVENLGETLLEDPELLTRALLLDRPAGVPVPRAKSRPRPARGR